MNACFSHDVFQHTHDKLIALGMSEQDATRKANLFKHNTNILTDQSDKSQASIHHFFIPGRLEFLGKHTDYCGGKSLVCAISRGICLSSRKRTDHLANIQRADSLDCIMLPIEEDAHAPTAHWANYPATAIRRFVKNFGNKHIGADIIIASDLPSAAGMSSSSAVVIGIWLALNQINQYDSQAIFKDNIQTNLQLAGYLSCVENGRSFGSLKGLSGVGTKGGSEDHVAIMLGQTGHLLRLSFSPLKLEGMINADARFAFIIATSGITAQKTGNAMQQYNRVSQLAIQLLTLWHTHKKSDADTLADAIRSEPDAREHLHDYICYCDTTQEEKHQLHNRLDQFYEENQVILPAVCELLRSGRTESISPIVARSQDFAERLLGNQIHETTTLVNIANQHGAVAASAFGAGFGGSVWALVRHDQTEQFIERWQQEYRVTCPAAAKHAAFFETTCSFGATPL